VWRYVRVRVVYLGIYQHLRVVVELALGLEGVVHGSVLFFLETGVVLV